MREGERKHREPLRKGGQLEIVFVVWHNESYTNCWTINHYWGRGPSALAPTRSVPLGLWCEWPWAPYPLRPTWPNRLEWWPWPWKFRLDWTGAVLEPSWTISTMLLDCCCFIDSSKRFECCLKSCCRWWWWWWFPLFEFKWGIAELAGL